MEKRKLNVGIAGYGVVGKRRRHFIDQNPALRIVAVCDQRFSGSGVMEDGIRFFPNYKEMLKCPLDILFVSLPNYLAAEVTIAGLESGLHVFCEKPPGRNVLDVRHVIETETKSQNLCLKYGFNHRYHDSVKEALRIIKSRELGDIINLRGVYGKSKIIPFSGGWRAQRQYAGGGILLDQGIHMVDLMCLFCGTFKEVKSYVSNTYWNHDVEDNAYAIMRDDKGRIAMLHSSATQWQHRFSLDIALSEGYLKLEGILSGSKSYGEEKLIIGRRSESDMGTVEEKSISYLEDHSWRDEVNEFADSVINGRKILNGTSQEALEAMKVVYRIYHADPEWSTEYEILDPDIVKRTKKGAVHE